MNTARKVVVITGASQGIGAGLVAGFLERGYRVVANSRSIEPDPSPDILTVAGDIADPAVADRVIGMAVERFGRVDTLLNNAGMFVPKRFTEYTAEDFSRVVALNLGGFFHISQRAIRQMLVQGGGHVVNFTTSLVNQPMKAVPSALASLTKGGLDAVTLPWPSNTRTRESESMRWRPALSELPCTRPSRWMPWRHCIRWGGWAKWREIVEAVMYLEGAGFVTGETLSVDGGAHAGRW